MFQTMMPKIDGISARSASHPPVMLPTIIGKDRRADNDAERIGADEIACLWDGGSGRLRHAGQKSHGGELAGSDKEATQIERDLRERHALRGGDNLVLYHDPCLSRAARITDQACPGFAPLKPPRVPWRVIGWR